MRVKNDFPDADRVLSKLKRYVEVLNEKKAQETDEKQKERYSYYLKTVHEFITSVANYLDSVCNSQDRIERARQQYADSADIRQVIQDEDNARSFNHSNIIKTMVLIDRISTKLGCNKIFDYAEEFENNYAELIATNIDEKQRMSERARIKRREMGNFGLYIAATVTAGMNREIMLTDDEAREFASCESDDRAQDIQLYNKVKLGSRGAVKSLEDIIK